MLIKVMTAIRVGSMDTFHTIEASLSLAPCTHYTGVLRMLR